MNGAWSEEKLLKIEMSGLWESRNTTMEAKLHTAIKTTRYRGGIL
jgi:hypothetical protein